MMDEPWGTDLEAEMSAGKMAVAFMVCSLCVFALFASDACYMGAQLGMFEHAVGQHWPPPLRLPRSPKSPADSDGRSRPGSLASVGSPSRGDGSLHVDHLPVAIDPAKVSLQLLIDQTALKTGKWPISLTGLNGTCVYRAESNATTRCAQQGKACIEIFTGDDYRMPVAIISEDFEFLDHSRQVYAKLRPVGPSNYILEPVGPSYILQQTPRLSFGLDPSGYLHVTPQSKNGNLKGAPYATIAPVYCLTECLEIAIAAKAQGPTAALIIAGVLGIIVFQTDRAILKRLFNDVASVTPPGSVKNLKAAYEKSPAGSSSAWGVFAAAAKASLPTPSPTPTGIGVTPGPSPRLMMQSQSLPKPVQEERHGLQHNFSFSPQEAQQGPNFKSFATGNSQASTSGTCP